MRAAVDPQGRALAAGLLLVLIWGSSFSIQKAAYAAMGPEAYLCLRAALMCACAAALLIWQGQPLLPRLEAVEWRALLAATLLGQVGHVTLVTYGIHWSTPFSSAVIMACGPVVTLVMLWLLQGTRLHPAQVAGVGAAMAGVLLFLMDKLVQADVRASGGDLMMLAATVAFSLYTIRLPPLVRRHGGVQVMCWTTLIAGPPMIAVTFVPMLHAPLQSVSAAIWTAFAWSVLISAFFGWLLWNWVNVVRGVARTAPLLYLVPPVAGVVAWVFVREPFGAWKIAGGALALGGVALTQWAATRVPN